MVKRPGWWPDWIPERDGEGHVLDVDNASKHWENCDCPAAFGGGHHVWTCRDPSCRAEPIRPPGHVGPARDQR